MVYNDDCLEILQTLEDASIDLVLTDPPYGTTSIEWDSVIPFDKVWEQMKRVVKPGGTIILFGIGLFSARLKLSNEKWYKYDLCWKKSKCGSPLLAKYRPMIKHEDIIVFTHGGGKHKTFNPQMEEGIPYKRENVSTKTNNHGFGIKQVTTKNEGTRYPGSVLDFPQQWRRQDQVHPTQKPVELLEYLIKTYSNENEMVLDFTMGSGSTGVACKNTNREFIGIEKDEKYFKIAESRIINN